MNILKKTFSALGILLFMNSAFSQTNDEVWRVNPTQELLGINAKTLGLKEYVKEMQEQKFSLDKKGYKAVDSIVFSNLYKFDQDGLTKEMEQNSWDLQSKKHFFSYTNKGYISHIDIEAVSLSKEKDTLNTSLDNPSSAPDFSTVDYKYVIKKNILYKGEECTEGSVKKVKNKNEYFYHFNDFDQINQIDYQSTDLMVKYIYDSNGQVKEMQTFKSGLLSYKNIYKYDRNNRLINMVTINSDNTTKYPNKETSITYKLESNGNIAEKKTKTYLYLPNGVKEYLEGYLHIYNYTY